MTLTGRNDELGTIRRVLHGSKHCGVMIVGPAGVGKTALARQVLSQAATTGDRTSWFVGTESARSLPLGAFTGAISQDMCDPLPSVRRLIDSFVAQQHQRRSMIGVDDAHLLDELSAHVLHQLAQARGVRLVVTARTGGAAPDAVTALWKDGLLARLDLEPLSADATRAFIEQTLGGPVDSRSARRFWKLTGGNALYLQQVLKDQIDGARLRQVAGVWMWHGEVAVSQSITDMVGSNLDRLPAGAAMVVDLLSQCEPLDVDVLCDLVSRQDLEAAESLRVVTVERDGSRLQVRLAHPLYGELRRATAGEMHLSGLRGRLVERLSSRPDDDLSATVRRALLMLGSDLKPDPQLYLDAARAAMTLLDPHSADRFAAAADECGAYEAAPMRAMSLLLLGRGEQTETVLAQISSEGRPDAHHWATLRAANLTWMLGRPRDAAGILEQLAAGPESEADRAARLAIQAGVDAVLGRCEAARDNARAAIASGLLPDYHAMIAAVALTMALGALGEVDDLNEVATDAIERAINSFESSQTRFWYGGVYARACRLTGRIDECVRNAKQLADSARDLPGLAQANLAFLLGHVELVRGAIPEAVGLLHEALAGVETHGGSTGLRPASCFGLAEAHGKLGQAEEAAQALAQARQWVPDDYVYMQTNLSLATGWAMAAGGSLTEAIAAVRAAATEAREHRQPTHELACLQAAAQWGDTSGAARAAELAAELRLPLADAVARHTAALAANDGAGLLDASGRYQAIGDRVTAADAAAQAAVAFSGSGQGKRGLYAAAVARQLATDCGGICTPALRHPAGQPLTQRQREIVEFVVAGLSNREIAKRLVMSVRSVEGHLYRACQRVGASSREELAAIVRGGFRG
ncbi:LuxR C-terminal-related transcriptional regulator [Mycobacterium aquaticum]|uniref:LuxR family transcriptional regulator n=1 Tax=Mycobacterium aquaticum TaxID=1927124 RepID=A0A1X0AN14_9MYCO|nr:LuxR family transcriptional regulator [Mycobacterium aquaticum]ORA31439.1 LuxR family transcriptional regulator [Mycobacterium aquaticum]